MVNIGSRQKNRERGFNVIDVGHDKNEIYKAIIKQIKKKKLKNLIFMEMVFHIGRLLKF